MKKTFRLTALILALLMLVNISASATTDGIPMDQLKMADWSSMLQTATQAAQVSEEAETVDADGEELAYHWGYLSGDASFNDVPVYGNTLGSIPANSLVKVIAFDSSNSLYQVEYNGVIGYIMGSYLSQCKCENASVTDPATHGAECIYPKYYNQLASEKAAADLYALWSGFTAEEQAFVLETLKNADESKYTELYALLHPATEDEKTETVDGTTVSVKGDIPADVELALTPVAEATAQTILPGMDLQNVQYFALDVSLLQNGAEWQPDGKVSVTISVNASVGQNGDALAIYHKHGDQQANNIGVYTIENGKVTFEMDGFSYLLGVNVSTCSKYCWMDDLQQLETATLRYEYLLEKHTGFITEYDVFMLHYLEEHSDSRLVCSCQYGSIIKYVASIYAPGDPIHTAECPWAFQNITAAEQADILAAKTEDEQLQYLKDEAAKKYSTAEIDAWFQNYNVTVEMVKRALRASSLESVVLEGDLTGYADLYYVRSGQAIAYYQYNTAENRGEIIEPSCQLVVAYVDVATETVTFALEDTAN